MTSRTWFWKLAVSLVALAVAWFEFHPVRGAAALEATYRQLVSGRVDPRAGYVCTLDPDA